ncbi:MAG: ABC transporter ATP-binding protein/permease [Oscillospiraceae bacterium]|jgi:ATP-binding cassette subfamily B protein|nr:ABC transporter ATP-binding protein/permease [Oscillospiraceae bacterium]
MARNKFDIDETLETPFNSKHLKRALVYTGKHKKNITAALIFSAFSIAIALLEPLIIRHAVDRAIPDSDYRLLVMLAIGLLTAVVTSVMLARMRTIIMTKVGQSVIYEIRRDVFAHLQKLSFEYYDSRPHGKILVRVINYINSVSDLMTNGIINFILEIFNLVFITVFMFIVSWRLALVVIAGLPLFAIFIFLIKNKQRKGWQAVSNKTSNLNAYLHESIRGVQITQLFAREKTNSELFDKLSRSYRKDWMYAIRYVHLLWPVSNFIEVIASVCVIAFGLLVFPGYVSLGTLIAMSGYAFRFWQPIINLSGLMNSFINAVAYLERIFELLDEPVVVNDIPDAAEMPEIKGDVEFKNVTFAYEDNINVLDHLSFAVKAGESIALVGPTGAGKTTIVNLISRFYNLNSGEILIDGSDISKVSLVSLRSQMGIMLQDSFIFSGTLMFNLKYGRLDATDAEVREACKIVGIHDYIMSLKSGYDTEVSERGQGLSGGQKQLISFARTILANPKILVLDEATSSIDAKTERNLQTGINYLLKGGSQSGRGRTSFIIAHRLSTIRNCDRIMYVSEQGITESGSHDELMAKKGDYYRLYTAQSFESEVAG